MSTRRSFLQSAVFLPSLLSARAFAQDSSSATLPFADFENGSWGDWTTEGLAFGDRPATDALFPGKIRGFGGRGFVCSLHPRKGNAATGKAVSREFVIEKPFITFKIGGGNFPGQACLNLVVDGKIERTATGDGTASLSEKSWDVSGFVGKKARLEIVDDTISEQRGYVLVDDIAFAAKIPAFPPIDFGNLPYQGQVTEMAERWRRDFGLPGVWCAFIKDGRVQACVASGTRKMGEDLPASVNDHLNVGSVSKVITGSLIAFFVADGTIKYETTVGEVFPELAKQFPTSPLLRATLRHLMTHTAGLTGGPAYGSDKSGGVAWRYGQTKLTLPLSNLREPGETSQYSNVGSVIATSMVERLSGKPYETWLFGELGKSIGITKPKMLDYSLPPSKEDVNAHYLKDGISVLNMLLRRDGYKYAPQGSCSITLTDLCEFAQFTMTNSAHLTQSVYSNVIHFPTEVPTSGFNKAGTESAPPIRHTSAGWGGNDQKYLMHNGDTARGEYCEVGVNCQKRQSLIFYTNCNNKEGTRSFMQGVGKDLNHLRLL